MNNNKSDIITSKISKDENNNLEINGNIINESSDDFFTLNIDTLSRNIIIKNKKDVYYCNNPKIDISKMTFSLEISRMNLEKKIYLGIMTYHNKDLRYASSNIGDYIQSLAAINIYRKVLEIYYQTTFEIEDFLEYVLNNTFNDFHFLMINRDSFKEIEIHPIYKNVSITVILNGWWMRPNGSEENVCDFPFPLNIDPIFVSFHVSDTMTLTKDGINYMKKHSPVGCRDVYTQNILKKYGIPSYFSGCLTQSIDFFTHETQNNITYYVDVKNVKDDKLDCVNISHCEYSNINADRKMLLNKSLQLLKKYSRANKVYTSRLHCLLPCKAMNVEVVLTGPDGSDGIKYWNKDPRFSGLIFNQETIEHAADQIAFKYIMDKIS